MADCQISIDIDIESQNLQQQINQTLDSTLVQNTSVENIKRSDKLAYFLILT